MKPIQTRYEGCWFRSRLEARWAVFFDALGIQWRYEPEGFDLGDDGWYLPDFYLPEYEYWIEVKGKAPTNAEKEKVSSLSDSFARKECNINNPQVKKAGPDTYIFKGELPWLYLDKYTTCYIFYGEIPWPFPEEPNAIGYGVYSGHRVEGKVFPHTAWYVWREQEGLCWQQCPLCSRFGIGKMNTMFCRNCYRKVYDALDSALSYLGVPELDRVFDSMPETVYAATTNGFLASGHKATKLTEAYEAARSARFEGRHRRHLR